MIIIYLTRRTKTTTKPSEKIKIYNFKIAMTITINIYGSYEPNLKENIFHGMNKRFGVMRSYPAHY